MAYKVFITTSAYRPMRCSKEHWEPGTTNNHMQALDGWNCRERNLREVEWRLLMFCGRSPSEDVWELPMYQSWLKQKKNKLAFHDKLCGIDRSTEICPPGFAQGYVDIQTLLNELEENGRVELPFSALYDARQYDRHMDGCALIVEEIPRNPHKETAFR